MINKKGDEYLSIWNILMWIVVVGAVVAGLVIFNNAKTDVRGTEARILAIRIADCVSQERIEKILTDEFNIYEECSLSKKVIEGEDYFVSISLANMQSQELKNIILGNTELSFQCQIKKEEKHFAECYEDSFYSNVNDGMIVHIKTASNNQERSL